MADFYIDHDVARELAVHLRLHRHSARTAQDLGNQRSGDDEHLSIAARNQWIFVTHNAKDFYLLHDAWRRWARDWGVSARHAGILVLIPPILPSLAATELSSLIRSGHPQSNELYIWRRLSGWVERP